jgi:Amt family ammonium transporter
MMACFNTNAAASAGMLGYVAVDYFKYGRKFSLVGACEGVIAGLVGITPAAGYVSPWLAAVIGLITGAVCALIQNVNDWLRIDESLDVFRLHGVGGMVGSFLTGIFAESYISSLDGATIASGAIDGNGMQVAYQLVDITAVAGYSFVVSCILLLVLKFTPGVHLRVSEEIETVGLDVEKFFDEQIGDWGLVEQLHRITYVGKVESTENTTPQAESLKAV